MRRVATLLLLVGCSLWPVAARATDAPRRLTLDEAVGTALKQNPEVSEALSRVMEAEARLSAARSLGQPLIRTRAAYDYRTEDQRLLRATRNGELGAFGAHTLEAEILVSVPLYTGGRLSAGEEAADWNRRAASVQVDRVRDTLVFRVTAVFYTLLAQDAVLRSLDAAVMAMDEQQRTTQLLVDAGKAARVDLLRAEVRRAELHERRLREQSARIVGQRAWAALLGLNEAVAPEPEGTLDPMELPVCPDADSCMQRALAQRPDRQAAQHAIAAAQASVRAARAGSLPTLSAQASYGGRWLPGAADVPEGAQSAEDVGIVGLVAEIPLFDGHLTTSKVNEQRARLRGAQERLRGLELQIRNEVESARAQIVTARERVQTSEQAVGQAEESFRVVKEKYDLGKGTLTDVLDSQSALVTAESNHARALADLAVAAAQRRLATGDMQP